MSEETEWRDLPTIRRFICACLCEWYMPDGIEPSYCPHCGTQATIVQMEGSGEFGYYDDSPR